MKETDNFPLIIDYIEEHLAAPLNVDELAHISYRSTMQLYRDFYSQTGFSIKEYIRRRRLSKALHLVKYSNHSLSSIAYELGYSSQQAFCKSVKSTTGLTPLEYKASGFEYYFPKFYRSSTGLQVSVSTLTIPEFFCVSYLSKQDDTLEQDAVEKLICILPKYRGRLFGRNAPSEVNVPCYELLLETTQLTKEQLLLLSEQFSAAKIEPSFNHLFALTTVENHAPKICSTWNYLYSDWMQNSMFQPSPLPYYEEYLLQHGKRSKLQLYLPVEKDSNNKKLGIRELPETYYLVVSSVVKDEEETTAEKLTSFLTKYYPYLLQRNSNLYIKESANQYTCGIQLDYAIPIDASSDISLFKQSAGSYAYIHSVQMTDGRILKKQLSSWLSDNGFHIDHSSCFTIYYRKNDTSESALQTAVYYPLESSVSDKML